MSSRGGRRGRPSRMERLRRETLAEAPQDDDTEEQAVPARADKKRRVEASASAGGAIVPVETWQSLGRSMRAVACPPLAQVVVAHAAHAAALQCKLQPDGKDKVLFDELWSPDRNAWLTTSLAARSQALNMHRKSIQAKERAAAAAVELSERHCQTSMLVHLKHKQTEEIYIDRVGESQLGAGEAL